tara:strand:+ start:2509 stop:3480 length:972 start_codon:yes stop_codon:yes gene_type:complete
MKNLYVGLMSGTSRDSLDGCLVSFDNGFKIFASETIDFSEGYQTSQDKAFIGEEITSKSIELVKKLIRNIDIQDVVAIAFPGQTILHNDDFSLQAGSPEIIAKATRIPVYSDFRNFDIARGGKGAPLIPIFHKYLLSEAETEKLVINIGGICNGTYLKDANIEHASDIGPGNCLLDATIRNFKLGTFDNEGLLASKGCIDDNLLEKLLSEIDFLSYPRADDISIYMNLFDKYKKSFEERDPEDILSTFAELTVKKIEEYFYFCNAPAKVIFHGGGTENKYLMKRIKETIKAEINTIDSVISSKYVESAAFAYLAFEERAVLFK